MTVLLLVRHAVTALTGKRLYGRTQDVHISDAGREQAGRLAGRLSDAKPAALYSSPLDRCAETAEPIAEACGLKVRFEDRLLEIDYGRWTGRSFGALSRTRLWRRLHGRHPGDVRFPEGETLAQAQRRMVDALEDIAERHDGRTVVVVGHGDPLALAVAHYAGVHVDLFQRIEIAPASVSALMVGHGEPKIRRLNDTGTLEDLTPPSRRRTSRR
jgi:probable phosphomutase (TIGR03848 family)